MEKKEYTLIVDECLNKIKEFDNEQVLSLQNTQTAIVNCRTALSRLKEYTVHHKFENQEEEVNFFKVYKGKVLKNLIYFIEVNTIERNTPVVSIGAQKKFIVRQEQKIKKFFKKHDSLVQYVTLNLTNLDTLFYTLKPVNESFQVCNESYHTDPKFYTNHDLLLAKIKAFQKVLDYLKVKYTGIEHFIKYGKPITPKTNMQWTGSKYQLVELIYGLHSSKVINNGETDIKKISQQFASTLNIDLSDIYKVYTEIKSRQKTPTKFLEEMTMNLRDQINKSYR